VPEMLPLTLAHAATAQNSAAVQMVLVILNSRSLEFFNILFPKSRY
jgi:hypothetical protein